MWWNTDIIAMNIVDTRFGTTEIDLSGPSVPVVPVQACVYCHLDVSFDQVTGKPSTYSSPINGNPWLSVGKDAMWRTRTTVYVAALANQTHFVLIAIFGPQKLVLVYSGAQGVHDHEEN